VEGHSGFSLNDLGRGKGGESEMSLTKEKIINDIYNHVGLSKTQSRIVVEKLFEISKTTLAKGEDLLISGFGKFVVKAKSARRGRNPQTTEDLHLRARRVVVFKTSGVLRKKINEGSISSQ
jgi:integration host factor subunit alpha